MPNTRRAWFTDTIDDVNGVANTIRRMAGAVALNGDSLTVVTSRASIGNLGIPIENFEPLGEFKLPRYDAQTLSIPPVLKMLAYIRRARFTELVISTPGPVGLTALLAARLLRLRTAGIYHTDFPQYVRILTGDASWEPLTWSFMEWFYSQTDLVWVNSESYRQGWLTRGMSPGKLRILPRGVDTQWFRPGRRSANFWRRFDVSEDAVVLLYVGRISREKDLDVIAAAWERLKDRGKRTLAFVGDGPYLPQLRKLAPDAIFTGTLTGDDLADAYAGADVFLFPSTTDTFGNVVLEALASGLPCVVSDVGGPQDLIQHGVTGIVTPGSDLEGFTHAVATLADDRNLRAKMGEAAAKAVADRDWREAARRFWAATE